MRTRHPFPDVQEREDMLTLTIPESLFRAELAAAMGEPDPPYAPEPLPKMHQGANRRQRREGVATFVGPKELGPGLRRDLLEQRQRRALGTLDVELRRLQRKQRKAKSK